jgi:hypothetical protein
MKLKAVHTCPVWEQPDGSYAIGIDEDRNHGPVVGWCNVMVIDFGGRELRLLAA